MGEGGESPENLQLVIRGKALLFQALLSQENWLFSTVVSRPVLEFLLLPLYEVQKMHPGEARRSSCWSSMR